MLVFIGGIIQLQSQLTHLMLEIVGKKDVASVRYHSQTLNKVSPIVARVKAKGKVTYIKLDGVHRLVAAAIRGSMVKVLFVDL